jgi:predicted nucleic acid-binding protein
MTGIDTNILIALDIAQHEFHGRAHAVFDPMLASGKH